MANAVPAVSASAMEAIEVILRMVFIFLLSTFPGAALAGPIAKIGIFQEGSSVNLRKINSTHSVMRRSNSHAFFGSISGRKTVSSPISGR